MEEGTITRWEIVEGDSFNEGDVICEVMTDKAINEVEAGFSGKLTKIIVQEDQISPVGETEINMETIVKLRENIDSRPSITSFLIWSCANSLKECPEVNGFFLQEEVGMVSEINIGVAVAHPEGLIVPVIKNADEKDLVQISNELKNLVIKGYRDINPSKQI